MEEKILHDLALPTHQKRQRRWHEVPDEHLVVVQRFDTIIGGRHGTHRAPAIADYRLPQQCPRIPLRLGLLSLIDSQIGGALKLLCLLFDGVELERFNRKAMDVEVTEGGVGAGNVLGRRGEGPSSGDGGDWASGAFGEWMVGAFREERWVFWEETWSSSASEEEKRAWSHGSDRH